MLRAGKHPEFGVEEVRNYVTCVPLLVVHHQTEAALGRRLWDTEKAGVDHWPPSLEDALSLTSLKVFRLLDDSLAIDYGDIAAALLEVLTNEICPDLVP